MSLPVFRRFSQADYPTAPEWLAQMFGPLNVFAETTVTSLNKNLTIGENVQGLKFSTSFVTDGTGVFTPIIFQYNGGGQPDCCIIGKILKADGTAITTPNSITNWYLNINSSPPQVIVNTIAGLDIDTKYNITFLVI